MIEKANNPFKFLDSFTKEDKDIYFGREAETEELYELLQQTDLILLYGETGTGKTSLVNCGLAQRLDDTEWMPIYIRRNRNINESVREKLTALLKKPPEQEASLTQLLQHVYWEQLLPVHLIFDQLEELFILGSAEEQETFIDNIKRILEEGSDTKVILVFREEYLAHLNTFEKEIPRLFDKRLRIETMRETKAREVIVRTCSSAGIELEDEEKTPSAILDIITEEGRSEIDLPYLQVFLFKLFERGGAKNPDTVVFDQALIRETGSLGNVLTRFLEEQVAQVEKEFEERSTVWLFLKFFVTPDGTKKPVSRAEIYDNLGRIIRQRKKLNYCLNYFTSTHILRPLDKGQYELTHDSIAAKIHRARIQERNQVPLIEGNPYKGLTPYSTEDSSIFFGRDKVIRETYQKLANQPLLVVTGASGSGKSSLIKAGLLPKLKEEGYHVSILLRPGNHPQQRIEQVLDEMRQHPETKKGFVLLIDQYEELITRTEVEEERDVFIQTLRELIEEPQTLLPKLGDKKVKVIITVRSDFEPQFEQLGLKDYWYEAKYVIPLLSRAELTEIVEKPAYLAATYFEPEELVDRIVNEVQGSMGSLPLLSFSLSLLFERCREEGRIITEESYREIGGVIGSLKTHADEIYHTLESEEQRTMRRIMLRMVSLEGAEIASRRVYLDELVFLENAENQRVAKVLDTLTESRLIVRGVDEAVDQRAYVEPAHDALVWGWGTLWNWINEFGKDNLFLQDRLREQVILYKKENEDERYLWDKDPRLGQTRSALWMNKDEAEFVDRSFRLIKVREEAERKKQVIELERERVLREEAVNAKKLADENAIKARKSARRSKILAFAFLILTLFSIAASILAFDQSRKAEMARHVAENQEAAARFQMNRSDSLLQELSLALNIRSAAQDTAEKQRARAESALRDLKENTSRIVDTLSEEASKKIFQLQYEQALGKYQSAASLGTRNENVIKGLMEVAFFYVETGEIEKGLNILSNLVINNDDESLKEKLYELNTQIREYNEQIGTLEKKLRELRNERDSLNKISGNEIPEEIILNLQKDSISILTLREAKKGFIFDARKDIRSFFNELDSDHFSFLQERYFPKLVSAKGGTFMMGCQNAVDPECRDDEILHEVRLTNCEIGETEITFWQYNLFATATGRDLEVPPWGLKGDNPVVYVSWYDAIAYANWLSEQKGLDRVYQLDSIPVDPNDLIDKSVNWSEVIDWNANGFRLPTEAEWEYAARGGLMSQGFLFSGSNSLEEVGWYRENADSKPRAVAQKKANELGLHDLSGNVWEWCWNWYDDYPIGQEENPHGPPEGRYRVLRGGSWGEFSENCRVSNRSYSYPYYQYSNYGFRLTKTGGQ